MELFVKLDVKAIQNGLISKVGGVKHFAVLAAIASFANDKGESYPSQDKIGEIVGYTRKTINSTIQELRKTIVNGEPLLKVVQVSSPQGRRNKYILSPKSGFWFGTNVTEKNDIVTSSGSGNVTDSSIGVVTEGLQEQELYKQEPLEQEPKEQEIIFDNAKAVLNYFRQKYFEKYGVAYQPSWGRDQAMIKNKLLSTFTDSDIKKIIDIVLEEYDSRWANPRFPRPSVGQLCSWLPNEALAIVAKKNDEATRIEADSKRYEMDDDHFEKLFNEF